MKRELQHTIGSNLRKYRREQNLTREELAEKAGLSVTFYSNLESGNRMMSIVSLIKLADSLGVTTDSLLYKEHSNAEIKNIELLLESQPAKMVTMIEKIVRLLINTLSITD